MRPGGQRPDARLSSDGLDTAEHGRRGAVSPCGATVRGGSAPGAGTEPLLGGDHSCPLGRWMRGIGTGEAGPAVLGCALEADPAG